MNSLATTLTRLAVILVSVMLAHTSTAIAAPAHDAPFVVWQPDGTPFEARLFGDERMNGMETLDGDTIVRDAASGFWTYADATATGSLATSVYVVGRDRAPMTAHGLRPIAVAPGAAPEGFGPDGHLPLMGSRPMLVLLVEFSDQRGHATAGQWRRRFFARTGQSVREHYRRPFATGLDITPAAERHGTADDGIVGWLTLDRAHPDFGGVVDGRAGRLARDAMSAAARHVDFAAFDADGDGRLSTSELLVVIVVAGHDASLPGGCHPSVWSHQSAIEPLTRDDVQLSPYAMVGETQCATPTTLERLTHEVDHLLGTADIAVDAQSVGLALATLTLAVPNGGEGWTFNSRRRIEWTSADLGGNVSVELSRDAGATWTTIEASTANDGAFNWRVTGPATNRARVRVCSITTPSLCDASDRNFRISRSIIAVVMPNGGESWAINTTRQIQWASAGPAGGTVRIELSRDAGTTWTPVVPTTGNDGAHNWLVTGPATNRARIRVCSITAPSVCDASNTSFRIAAGALTTVTPNGGESWDIGSTQRIAWTSSGAVGGNVRVDLSRDGGGSWTSILASIANDGAQNWRVTGPATTDARIRVCRVTTPFNCDPSNASFTISDGSVRVLTPNGGESWPIGGTRRIEWTSSAAGNVRVEVSRDGGNSWTSLFASIANDGAQNWTVTGPATSQARIRVCSVDVPTACDTSDADFAVTEAADLVVQLLSFTPADVLGGQAWLVRVRTANIGVVPADASRTDIYIGPTSATGTIRLTGIDVPALAPGVENEQQKVIAFPFTVPPDTYFVFARVDATDVVPEGDEANEFVLPAPTLLVH